MRWRKLGHVYAPSGEHWWARSYATIPTADVIDDRTIRVYYASLDSNRYGRIGYVELDALNPLRILYETTEPVLNIGEVGTFDDSGVNPSCLVARDGKKFLYYIGWQRAERAPYMLFAGCAVSNDGGCSFERLQRNPILDRTSKEPFLRSATTVCVADSVWRIWYVSASKWHDVNGKRYPKYSIFTTSSLDQGMSWQSETQEAISLSTEHEFGLGRPWVIRNEHLYQMWYSIRTSHQPYQMGYAESRNGIEWIRQDDLVGITRSQHGWDSEMICYPCVVDVAGRRYMFYNGNQHGLTGFGCAVLESD
jgi:hypothetical protein